MTITTRGSPDQVSDPTMTEGALWFPENREQTVELWKRACVELESVAGTNTITATAAIPLDAYAKGQMWSLIPANDNMGAATLNIDSKGARALKKADGSALSSGDLQAGTLYLLRDDGTNLRVAVSLASGAAAQTHLILVYSKNAGLDGGTVTAGSRQTFPLNTEVLNTVAGASFDDTVNQADLPAGTYMIDGMAGFSFSVGETAIYLYNVTDAADVTTGIVRSQSYNGQAAIRGVFTLATAKTIELQYSAGDGQVTTGLGAALNDDGGADEHYGYLMLTKLA